MNAGRFDRRGSRLLTAALRVPQEPRSMALRRRLKTRWRNLPISSVQKKWTVGHECHPNLIRKNLSIFCIPAVAGALFLVGFFQKTQGTGASIVGAGHKHHVQ